MHDGVVVQLALVAHPPERPPLGVRRIGEHHQTPGSHCTRAPPRRNAPGRRGRSDDHPGAVALDPRRRGAEADPVAKPDRQILVDATRAALPGDHGRRPLDVEEIQVTREHRRRHVEDRGRQDEVHEERLQDLHPEGHRDAPAIEHLSHRHVVERVRRGEEHRRLRVQDVEALQESRAAPGSGRCHGAARPSAASRSRVRRRRRRNAPSS